MPTAMRPPRRPAERTPVDPAIYARVFDELRDGQAILEELIHRFSKPAKREGGIDAIIETYYRDGARSVVEFIVRRINAAHGVHDVQHDDPA